MPRVLFPPRPLEEIRHLEKKTTRQDNLLYHAIPICYLYTESTLNTICCMFTNRKCRDLTVRQIEGCFHLEMTHKTVITVRMFYRSIIHYFITSLHQNICTTAPLTNKFRRRVLQIPTLFFVAFSLGTLTSHVARSQVGGSGMERALVPQRSPSLQARRMLHSYGPHMHTSF